MLNMDTMWKPVIRKLCGNISNYGYIASFMVVLLLACTFPSSAALEMCGGIRNRFVCDDQDPTVFHICLGNHQYVMTCPGTLHFNVRTQNCDWPDSVNCVQEALSRQSSGTFSPQITLSPISTKTDYLVARQRDTSISRTRPTPSFSIPPLPVISAQNSTDHSLKASVVPDLEESNVEIPSSKYRLKVVPAIDKPIESLLPADEKVIEEVKKLSEELKHIDNYLQSLESDQVGFMIEPYMAKFPRRRPSYSHRYMHANVRKEVVPPFTPYNKKWMSPVSPLKKMTSPNSYAVKTTKYHHSRSVNNLTPRTTSTVVSAELKTRSPYKPTPMLYRRDYPSTTYKRHNTPTIASRYTKKFSKAENTPIPASRYAKKFSKAEKDNTPIPASRYAKILLKAKLDHTSAAKPRYTTEFSKVEQDNTPIPVSTYAKKFSKSEKDNTPIPSSRYTKKLLKAKFDHTPAPTPRYTNEFSKVEQDKTPILESRYTETLSKTEQGNTPILESRYTETLSKTEQDTNSVINKNNHLKVNDKHKPHGSNLKPSEIRTPKLPVTQRIHKSTDNLFSARSLSIIHDSETPQKPQFNTAKRLDHARSNSSTQELSTRSSTTDARITQSLLHRLQGRATSRIRQNDPRTSNVPVASTTWWSKAKSGYYSTPFLSHRPTKVTETTLTRKYTNAASKSSKPLIENISTSSTVTVRPESSKWWASTQSDSKSTMNPIVYKRLNRRKYKPRHYNPKPNYNTRTPDVDFALIPSKQKSSSYMSLAKHDRLFHAPSNFEHNFALHNSFVAPAAKERNFALHNSFGASEAKERNFALHNSFGAPSARERNFALHNVNAAASADRIALHNPYNNPRPKNEAPSQTDKVFALHKSDNDLKANVSAYRSPVEKYETKKGKCSLSWCQLPDCRCIGPDIPGDLDVKDIPQMVMLTFDDSINSQNMHYFRGLFNGTLKNPNGCPVKSTFFVSGDSSDYDMVKRIYKQGHEIASHTMSHRDPTTWWANAGFENWEKEIVGMRDRLHQKSGVPVKEITGMRAPFLQVGGDGQYAMLKENKFRYDSSMVTGNLYSNNQPPIWPFTLDTPPDRTTCSLTPCPTRSYPGLWEVPLIRWYGSNKIACAMPDACTIDLGTKGSRKFIDQNFNRYYTTNRAPFGIFIHASWFLRKDGNFQGLFEFLASLAEREDVWVVTLNQALDWIQHPVRLSELNTLKSWHC